MSNFLRLPENGRGVGNVRREATAEEGLTACSTEDLIVRREQLQFAQRRDAELHARTSNLLSEDPLLQTFHPVQLYEVTLRPADFDYAATYEYSYSRYDRYSHGIVPAGALPYFLLQWAIYGGAAAVLWMGLGYRLRVAAASHA